VYPGPLACELEYDPLELGDLHVFAGSFISVPGLDGDQQA